MDTTTPLFSFARLRRDYESRSTPRQTQSYGSLSTWDIAPTSRRRTPFLLFTIFADSRCGRALTNTVYLPHSPSYNTKAVSGRSSVRTLSQIEHVTFVDGVIHHPGPTWSSRGVVVGQSTLRLRRADCQQHPVQLRGSHDPARMGHRALPAHAAWTTDSGPHRQRPRCYGRRSLSRRPVSPPTPSAHPPSARRPSPIQCSSAWTTKDGRRTKPKAAPSSTNLPFSV